MTAADMSHALVVSSHGLVRSAVIGVLASLEMTVHECADVSSAGRDMQRFRFELVLADLEFEWDAAWSGGFAQWCARLPEGVRIIALAASRSPMPAVPAGCQLLTRDASASTLARLVATTIDGSPPKSERSTMTDRQREVLEMAARGSTNQEIGQALVISTGTVKRHLHDAFTVLGARSRVEAVALARSRGLI